MIVYLLLILTALFSFLFMIGMFYAVKYLFFDKVFKQNFLIGVAVCFALAVVSAVFCVVIAAASGSNTAAALAQKLASDLPAGMIGF